MSQAYQPYLGKSVSAADLGVIAEAMSAQYRGAGFHLSRVIVLPQDGANGRIRFHVIEGSITDVTVDGDPDNRFGIAAMLAPVTAQTPSRQDVLERQLLLINGLPGVRMADTALEEIGTASGRFRLKVFVKTWQVYTSFGIDNLGSSSVGPWQTYATGAFNSYLRPGDILALNLSTIATDPRQLGFARLSYETPIGVDGVRIGGSALYSEVRPGDWRRQFGDVTKTQSYEVHASIAPLQSQTASLVLTTAATFSDVSESDTFGAIYNDHLRIVSLTADYRLKDDLGGVNYVTATWRQGLNILGASRPDDDFTSRIDGSAAATVLNVWFTRYQSITDAVSLKISAAGQVASAPLLSSQQFYLGGASFGRGYGNAEISGDNAIAGSIELRYDGALDLPFLKSYQLYGYVDSGAAWNVGYTYRDGLSLTSAGGGVRFFLDGDLRIDVGVGVPLSYRSLDNEDRNPRFLLTLSNSFQFCPSSARLNCL
ncbi:MAG: ShlB/FhaC/HecB family hemolysin secretion/activation protein [Tardiphaga sp.]